MARLWNLFAVYNNYYYCSVYYNRPGNTFNRSVNRSSHIYDYERLSIRIASYLIVLAVRRLGRPRIQLLYNSVFLRHK